MCCAVNRSAAGDVYAILNDGYKLGPLAVHELVFAASDAVTVANDMLITVVVYNPTRCKTALR